MATHTSPLSIGIDVSKAELVVCTGDDALETICNNRPAVRRWLKRLAPGSALAVEATGSYHRLVAELGHALGHIIYMVDGYRLNRYRDGVGQRAKTDPDDARLLRRYLVAERPHLTPWTPPPAAYTKVYQLLTRRATLVQARDAVRQSCRDVPMLKSAARTMLASQDRFIQRLDQLIDTEIRKAGWEADYRRCMAIEGVGPLTAAALVNAFHRGRFQSADALVAFLGLDVKVRDSGTQRGKRKLTKKGAAEYRRVLYMAAMAARRSTRWQPVYQHHLNRGRETTEAIVILSRKLVRVAYALMRDQTEYRSRLPEAA